MTGLFRRVRRLLAERRVDGLIVQMLRHGADGRCPFDGCPEWAGLCDLLDNAYDTLARTRT